MAPMKDKNSYPKWDLNLWPLGLKCKTLPLNHEDFLQKIYQYFIFIYQPNILVLAIFSQLPPISANFHLYSTNLDLLPQLLNLYDMNGVSCGLFQNEPFCLYLCDPWTNFENIWREMIHFIAIFLPFIWFFFSSVETPEKKFI